MVLILTVYLFIKITYTSGPTMVSVLIFHFGKVMELKMVLKNFLILHLQLLLRILLTRHYRFSAYQMEICILHLLILIPMAQSYGKQMVPQMVLNW